ncbi:MAG: hypothetical protein JO208_08625 [Alphaproteobacteria bacterium]|nr:hypothetical protein [Alphaproteobacteria bacterium]
MREIVSILQERIQALGLSRLRIRVEPNPVAQLHHSKNREAPKRLVIQNDECHYRVDVSTMEMAVLVGEKLVVTSTRPGAIKKLAQAVIDSIKGVVRSANE